VTLTIFLDAFAFFTIARLNVDSLLLHPVLKFDIRQSMVLAIFAITIPYSTSISTLEAFAVSF
jgi:hypothetical protein